MNNEIIDLRNRVAAAIRSAIPGERSLDYENAADKALEAISEGQCSHEWNWDGGKGIYWCSSCEAMVSNEMATTKHVVSQAHLDEMVDRPIPVRAKP